jgi:hypothetical protein
MGADEHQPDELARRAGRYEEQDVSGTRAGPVILPSEMTKPKLLARAAEYRHMAETAGARDLWYALIKMAKRYERMAESRRRDQ